MRFGFILPSLISVFYTLKYNIVILHLPNSPSNITLVCISAIETLFWGIDRNMKKSQIKWADN